MELLPLYKMAIAVGLGLLIGLQREWSEPGVAGTIPLGAVVLVALLHWKNRLHGFVHRIGRKDLPAVGQMVLIGLGKRSTLGARPNRPYPYPVRVVRHKEHDFV